MREINFNFGPAMVNVQIEKGVAILKASDTASTRQIYLNCLKAGQRHVIYNERSHCLIEKFPGRTDEEIEKMLYYDMQNALREQFKAKEWAMKKKMGGKDDLNA